jgi:molybdopterin-binding protein
MPGNNRRKVVDRPEHTTDAFSSRQPGIHFARKRYNIGHRRAVSAGEAPDQGDWSHPFPIIAGTAPCGSRRHARESYFEGSTMRISARNQIKGTVVDVTKGATTSHVRVDIGNGQIVTSSITNEAVDELGIKAKGNVTVVVKASDVMIAVD